MRIGAYEVLGELGRGCMGVVYRARAADGREVALKVFGAAEDPDGAFEREARLLWSFSHADGFVPVIDSGMERGRRHLVMPLLQETLRARLRRGKLPVDEAVAVVSRVAEAMGRAHARGVVHRDLKPENILLDGEGRPFVADLGLAKHFRRDVLGASKSGSVSQTGTISGTPGYMAPEQLQDSKRAQPQADVFALGAILHEALTGRRAFEGIGLLGYAEALLGKTPTRPSRLSAEVPRWLDEIVLRALEKNPEARFADAGQLARALARGRTRVPWARAVFVLATAALAVLAAVSWPRPAAPAPPVRAKDTPPRVPPAPPPSATEIIAAARKKKMAGDLDGAIADAERAIQLDPSLPEAWEARAEVRVARGDCDGGIADLKKELEIVPDRATVWADLAGVRIMRDDFEGGIADFSKAIEVDPRFVSAWVMRGSARLARSDYDGAIEDATRALELEPNLDFARVVRGNARQQRGDHEGALEDLNKAIELNPKLQEAWTIRGLIRLGQGDAKGAVADLERAVALQPGAASTERARRMLAQARKRAQQ